MRQILNDVEAGQVSVEISRRGIPPTQRLRVLIETLDDPTLPISEMAEMGGAFEWLADEPELYSEVDIIDAHD